MEKLNSIARAYATLLAYSLVKTGNIDDLVNSYTTDCAYEELEAENADLAFYLTILAPRVYKNGDKEQIKEVEKNLFNLLGWN